MTVLLFNYLKKQIVSFENKNPFTKGGGGGKKD